MHAENRRTARTGVLVAAPSVLLPAAVNGNPDGFSAAQAESGSRIGSVAMTRSPLPPAAAFYEEALGWPTDVQGTEIVVECGGVLDVVAMPVGLAGEVNHLLKVHLLHAPVMEVRGDVPTWAFFCAPRELPHGARAMATLALHRVTHFGAGTSVPLPPSPTCSGTALRWVDLPQLVTSNPLPPWASVASCALRATQR